MKWTVKDHIRSFLFFKQNQNSKFYTHDLQNLSLAWFTKFNYRLGSPETYTREFRRLRLNKLIDVEKVKRKNKEQQWKIKEINI